MYDIVMMDFENSLFDKNNLNLFYIDLTKFFSLSPMFIKKIDTSVLNNCIHAISSHALVMKKDFGTLLKNLFALVDEVKLQDSSSCGLVRQV
jgi:hypothetical protein